LYLSEQTHLSAQPLKPSRIGVIITYLVYTAVIVRALGTIGIYNLWPEYLGLLLVHLVLFTVVLWRPGLRRALLHLYLIVQSAIILRLISLFPDFDFVEVLFVPLCYQVALLFTSPTRWTWIGVLNLLIAGSLMPYYGYLRVWRWLDHHTRHHYSGVLSSITRSRRPAPKARPGGELQRRTGNLKCTPPVEELAMQERNWLARD
jgi:hypothetical protein